MKYDQIMANYFIFQQVCLVTTHVFRPIDFSGFGPHAPWRGGGNCVTFDRAKEFRPEPGAASFINPLVRAWLGPGAGLVLIKAAPK